MLIKTIKVGSLQTNCYILTDEASGEAVVIDPGDEADLILPEVKELNVKAIILTHGHPDHFGALAEVKKATGVPLYQSLNEGEEIVIGKCIIKVIATPGHSLDSICLYVDAQLFSGDTLFYKDHGRTDLSGGSALAMRQSLKRLAGLPPETVVYPGHGRPTTIRAEKENGTLG